MGNALMSENQRDFWYEVKHIDSQCNTLPKLVDGEQSDQGISNVFAEKYKHLYNCVSYDKGEMHDVYESLNEGVKTRCETGLCQDSHSISLSNVSDAISKLKCNKSDGVHVLLSDSLIHSCKSFHFTPIIAFYGHAASWCLSSEYESKHNHSNTKEP